MSAVAKPITLRSNGDAVIAHQWLTDEPLFPDDLVLGYYPDDLDAACNHIDSILTKRMRSSGRLVVIISDDLRIIAGAATKPAITAILKKCGLENQVGRYTRGHDIASLREDIETTARALIQSRSHWPAGRRSL